MTLIHVWIRQLFPSVVIISVKPAQGQVFGHQLSSTSSSALCTQPLAAGSEWHLLVLFTRLMAGPVGGVNRCPNERVLAPECCPCLPATSRPHPWPLACSALPATQPCPRRHLPPPAPPCALPLCPASSSLTSKPRSCLLQEAFPDLLALPTRPLSVAVILKLFYLSSLPPLLDHELPRLGVTVLPWSALPTLCTLRAVASFASPGWSPWHPGCFQVPCVYRLPSAAKILGQITFKKGRV